MERREFLLASLLAGVSAVNPATAFDFGKVLEAGKGLAQAASLSDTDLNAYFDQMTKQTDAQNKVAPPDSVYAKRLAKLTTDLQEEDGLRLNYKVYLTPEINAFAMANGTIRVYSGLMDRMTDGEITYVIGHEIGHVKSGHSKSRMQTAMATGAARNAAAAVGGDIGTLAESQIGDLVEKVIKAQHSQANERQADDYSLAFMKRKKLNGTDAVSALEKLAAMGGSESSWLSTHPSPKERADRLRAQLA